PNDIYAFVKMKGGVTPANTRTLKSALGASFPNTKLSTRDEFKKNQAGAEPALEPPLRAARAVGRDQLVRDREHARAHGLRTDSGARHAARGGDDPAAGAAHDPARERRHGADRRGARHRPRVLPSSARHASARKPGSRLRGALGA